MSELAAWLDEEEVARLCGTNQEWVWSRRNELPCVAGSERFDVRVRREDLVFWLEAARRFAARVEQRDADPEFNAKVDQLQAKYPGSANETRRTSRQW